jgi:uncharacterized membrane protein YeaQ/YmgE (transglycosylase-associated protein family)
MDTTYYFIIGLTYLLIGLGSAILFYYIFQKQFLGNFWGALLVGLIGSFLGGVIDLFFADIIEALANINDSVNIFPPLITAVLLLVIFSKISEGRD